MRAPQPRYLNNNRETPCSPNPMNLKSFLQGNSCYVNAILQALRSIKVERFSSESLCVLNLSLELDFWGVYSFLLESGLNALESL